MKTYTIEYNLLGTIEIDAEDAADAREQFSEISLKELRDTAIDWEITDVYAVV